MKWVLVWWVFNPWHPQVVHTVHGLESQAACEAAAAKLQDAAGKTLHWHCSEE